MDDEATQRTSQDYAVGERVENSISHADPDYVLKLTADSGWSGRWLLRRSDPNNTILPDGQTVWTFGRGLKAQFRFPAERKRLSGVHFKIMAALDEKRPTVFLQDTSTNGTYLNNTRIPRGRKCMLASGDDIIVGMGVAADEIKLTVHIPNQGRGDVGSGTNAVSGSQRTVEDAYAFHELIGQGAFATVRRATNRDTGRAVAIKIVERSKLIGAVNAAVQREISILTSLRHPHIVCLHEIFEDVHHYYLVMDLVEHGDLMDMVTRAHEEDGEMGLGEAISREVVRQILDALAYMHARGVSHRDLKPDNILVDSMDPVRIKVADFGLAKLSNQGTFLKTFCGTLSYLAPEVLVSRQASLQQPGGGARASQTLRTNPYTHKVDVWSAGCVAYVLLTGCMPFSGETQEQLFSCVSQGSYHRSPLHAAQLSAQATSFIARLLEVDPQLRPEAADALHLPWLDPSSANHLMPSEDQFAKHDPTTPQKYPEYRGFMGPVPSLEPEPVDLSSSIHHRVDGLGLGPTSSELDGGSDQHDSDEDSAETRHRAETCASQRRIAHSQEYEADPRDLGDGNDLDIPEGTWAILRTVDQSIPFKDVCISRDRLVIGREPRLCDVAWTDRRISRQALRIERMRHPQTDPEAPGRDEVWVENLSEGGHCFAAGIQLKPHERVRLYNSRTLSPGTFAVQDENGQVRPSGLVFRLEIVDEDNFDLSTGPPPRAKAKPTAKREHSSDNYTTPAPKKRAASSWAPAA